MSNIVNTIPMIKTENTNSVETVHNFIDFRDMTIRKGAIRAYQGEKMIIPFNMADGILLCEGKTNMDWNNSAPHGAGRVLSRSGAKAFYEQNPEAFMETFKNKMSSVFSTSVCVGTVDESPMAYKDSVIIEAAIQPTATIIDRLKPVINLKSAEENSRNNHALRRKENRKN